MPEQKIKSPYIVGEYAYPTPGAEKRGLLPQYSGGDIKGILRAEAHKRAEGFAKGERIGSRPGRHAREKFEALPSSRAAVKDVETGRVYRGGLRDVHGDIHETYNLWDELEYTKADPTKYKHESGFTVGREGKFATRAQMKELGGAPESRWQQEEELDVLEEKGSKKVKARLRAGSKDPREQYRRRMRGEKAKLGVKAIKSEIKLLRKSKTRESPEALRRAEAGRHHPGGYRTFNEQRLSRIQQLTRRLGTLKNLARKAGVFGVVSTPVTTGEALVGITSSDENERLRSIEILLGLPEFSTGRRLSEKEKKTKPVWYDPTTGEGKL